MIKSKAHLILIDKQGKTIFDLEGRRSKILRSLLRVSIRENWLCRKDLFNALNDIFRWQTIFQYLQNKKEDK
jgi:hypothetical protein